MLMVIVMNSKTSFILHMMLLYICLLFPQPVMVVLTSGPTLIRRLELVN